MVVVKKGLFVNFVIFDFINSVLNSVKKMDNIRDILIRFHTEIEVIVFVGVGDCWGEEDGWL